jgi:hypothetical protein
MFQEIPERKVIFEGDAPTRDEIITCLTGLPIPVFMVPVFEVIIFNEIARMEGGA